MLSAKAPVLAALMSIVTPPEERWFGSSKRVSTKTSEKFKPSRG